MALRNGFYTEIFNNEKIWIDLIENNLLNTIYCNLVLKPFYEEKKKELEQEYNLTGNKIIEQIILIIENIINQIDLFKSQYDKGDKVNMHFILPLFLTNQMNNQVFNNLKDKIASYMKNNGGSF